MCLDHGQTYFKIFKYVRLLKSGPVVFELLVAYLIRGIRERWHDAGPFLSDALGRWRHQVKGPIFNRNGNHGIDAEVQSFVLGLKEAFKFVLKAVGLLLASSSVLLLSDILVLTSALLFPINEATYRGHHFKASEPLCFLINV